MDTPVVPNPFPEFNTTTLRKGVSLIRVHDPGYPGNSFNPCKGGLTRFAPLALPSGACLPTLYAADDYESALFETVFHDIAFDARPAYVALPKLTSRTCSRLVITRDLVLANLREADLNKIGLTRASLVDTLAAQYTKTGRWAEGFHRGNPDIAGLVWTSRRCDPQSAYLLFGDRVDEADLAIAETARIAGSPELVEQARRAGQRAGITLTV
jgi:hypothetical protein